MINIVKKILKRSDKKARSQKWGWDGLLLLVLLITTFCIAFSYIRAHRFMPLALYQSTFEPAIFMACGKGFAASPDSIPQIAPDFLEGKVDHFSCSEIPADRPIIKTDIGVRDWYYLVASIAALWKMSGISWSSISYLSAFLASITVGLSYVIFRLSSLNRVFSFLASIGFLFSSVHLVHLQHLRDYAPAPFVLGVILILYILVSRELNFFRMFFLSMLLGGVVGLGYGFRGDILILIPIIFITFLFFIPRNSFRKIPRNAVLFFIFLVSFFTVAHPVFETFKRKHFGSCLFHTAQQGFAEPFSKQAHILPALYDWGDRYSDSLTVAMGASYGIRMFNFSDLDIDLGTYHYYLATKSLYFKAVQTFPADILTRLYGSVISIFNPYRLILANIFILSLSVYHFRLALWILICVLYYYGYPAIQFDERHYFYLTFWFWFLYAFFIYHIGKYFLIKTKDLALLDGKKYWKEIKEIIKAHGKGILLFQTSILFFLLILLWSARYYQYHQVKKMVSAYENAETIPVNLKPVFENNSEYYFFNWFDPLEGVSKPPVIKRDPVGKLMKIKIGGQRCSVSKLEVSVEYMHNYELFNFSRNFSVSLFSKMDSPYTLYIPLYFYTVGTWWGKPVGIKVVPANTGCIMSIDFIQDPHFYPLWLTLQLPQDSQQWKWYQALHINLRHLSFFDAHD